MRSHVRRVLEVIQLRPHDTSTEAGQGRERYRRATLNAATALIARGATIIAGLVSVPLCLRYLGNERYGMWLTLSGLLSLAAVADFGVLTSLQLGISKCDAEGDREAARRLVSSSVAILAVTTSVGLVLLIVLVRVVDWSTVFNVHTPLAMSESNAAVLAIGAAWLLGMFAAVVLRVSYGYQEGFATNLFQILGNILSVFGILILINLRVGLPLLVVSLGGMPAISLLLQGIHLFGWKRPWLRPTRKAVQYVVVRQLLGTGRWHLVAALAYAGCSLSTNIIVAQQLGASQVAELGVPLRVVGALLMIFGVVANASMPAFSNAAARGDRAWVQTAVRRSVRGAAALGLIGAVSFVVAGPKVIALWVGDHVHPSRMLIAGFATWSVVNGISTNLSSFVLGTGGVRMNCLQWLGAVVLVIPLQYGALHLFGIVGIPWAMAAAELLGRLVPAGIYYRVWARDVRGAA